MLIEELFKLGPCSNGEGVSDRFLTEDTFRPLGGSATSK